MDQSSKEEATKQRIITHMNADHQDSLVRYLRHTHHLSSFSARNAHLQSLTLSSLTISTSRTPSSPTSQPYLIPISPPMSSYSEARTRLASLDADAVSALGISPITLKKYTWPKGSLAIIFTCTLLTLLTFPRRQNFQPGANIHSLLSQFGDWGIAYSKFCYTIQPFLIYPLVGLHAFEVAYMERSRLSRYNVPRFSGLWWKWVASTFVEGWGAFVRVDGMVKEEEEKRAKAKH